MRTINGPCDWHQAIAGLFNNKNLNAKLIMQFQRMRFMFLCIFVSLRVNHDITGSAKCPPGKYTLSYWPVETLCIDIPCIISWTVLVWRIG